MSIKLTLSLGGLNYSVPPLNMDQQARGQAIDKYTPNALFEIFKIAMERAEPKLSQPDELVATR
jgi:hypothetical protein